MGASDQKLVTKFTLLINKLHAPLKSAHDHSLLKMFYSVRLNYVRSIHAPLEVTPWTRVDAATYEDFNHCCQLLNAFLEMY